MVRRSAGFVSKKPHRKSRGGCLTCKRKRVKCDETQPACGYCALRRLNCDYPPQSTSPTLTDSTSTLQGTSPQVVSESPGVDFNDNTSLIPSWIQPVGYAATGELAPLEIELLHHYQTSTWKAFAVRGDHNTHTLHRERVPQMGVAHSYLLYALLSISASHRNSLQPSKLLQDKALVYRQKTYQAYTKELQNITSDSYEPILMTGCFLLALIPPPGPDALDQEHLDWMFALLKLSEGLRILISLQWSRGIEKLSVYPLICRELRTLPPVPVITPDKPALQTRAGPLGTTPDHPNPASTYDLPYVLPFAGFVFLPPPLIGLLESIMHPPASGLLDVDANTLIPVFHVLSPVFLSLYYYHLNPDFNVRIFVFTSFLMPDFLALVKAREPRAMVLVAWFFALSDFVPHGWWIGTKVGMVVEAVSRKVRKVGEGTVIKALEGAERIVEIHRREGRARAAESVFDGWEGVNWDEGPRKAQEWEEGLADLTEGIDLCDLGLEVPS